MEIRVLIREIDGHKAGEIADYPEWLAHRLVALEAAEYVGASDADEPPAPQAAAKEPTKDELVARCKELGLSARGTKDELKARIAAAEDGDAGDAGGADAEDAADEEPPVLSAEVPR